MKKLIFLMVPFFLFAFKAKVEPFEIYNIKSDVAGKVIWSEDDLKSVNGTVLKLDDYQNRIDLENLKNQKKILAEEIKLQKEVVNRKERIYKIYQKMTTKSQNEKDLKFYDFVNSKNSLLNLENQLSGVEASIKKIEDTIEKKNIKVEGYLYKIFVKRGDFVGVGSLVAQIADISKEKLTIYVPISQKIGGKIYINGKESNFKIYRKGILPDTKFLTSYRVELVGSGLKFGDVVDVEFK